MRISRTSGVILALVFSATCSAGPIAPPPGPVSSTYRTLQEIEPRTPITALPMTITQPGSYYLVGNLTTTGHGIVVDANDVTIDLNGFTITGAGPSAGTGILILSLTRENTIVRNGTIRSFENGVTASQSETGHASTVEDLRVLDIGLSGIDLRGDNNMARNCLAELSDTPAPVLPTGIGVSGGVIEGCRSSGFSYGFALTNGTVVVNSVTTGGEYGIVCLDGLVNGCSATGASTQNLLLLGTAMAVDTYAP